MDHLFPFAREEMNHAAFEGYEHFARYIRKWEVASEEPNPYFRLSAESVDVRGTTRPWIYRSGIKGPGRIVIDTRALKGRYTVRLHFAEVLGAALGKRVFDVKIGSKTVLRGFDVVREAGGPNTAVVREFANIKADRELCIEFVPKRATSDGLWPILCGLEVEGDAIVALPEPAFEAPARLVAFSGRIGVSHGKPIPVSRMYDGNTKTFGVIHDDDSGRDDVQGHMVFDLGRPRDISAVRLTGRDWGQAYNPKGVDLFYYADDNPANNAVQDDIEGDKDIVLIASAEFRRLLNAQSQTVEFKPVRARRYIGLRINSSHEKGNFQASGMEIMVVEPQGAD